MLFNVSKELFAHIDCDCFYASCEILRDPKLRDKCVCVWGDIIITSNYNARKYGVKVGTPIWEAERMIPKREFVMLPPDMHYYGNVSERMTQYLSQWSNSIERFSIDEVWANITGIPEYKKLSEYDFARFLQSELLQKVGIPVSIGVSNTRLRAKILSEIHKPMGVCVGSNSPDFLHYAGALPFWDIPFIGRAYQDRLQYKVRGQHIAGFIDVGFWELKRIIGKNGTDIWLELRGVNMIHPVNTNIEKSISATRSFNYHKTSDESFVWNHLLMNFDRAYGRLVEKNLDTNHVIITFRNKEKQVFGLDMRCAHTQSRTEILSMIERLFKRIYSPDVIYRTTGVTFSGLKLNTPKQYTLEDVPFIPSMIADQKLEKAINALNKQFGRWTVMRGGYMQIDPRYMSEFLEVDDDEELRRIPAFMDVVMR